MVRVFSGHSYYKYLEKYSAGTLRAYQSGVYRTMGRG